MEAYRTEAVVESDGTITLGDLPFRKGEKLEVTLQSAGRADRADVYPLRGEHAGYIDPFGSVAADDWSAAN